MKKFLRFIGDKFLSGKLDLRVRLFNVLAMVGISGVIIIGFVNLFSGVGVTAALIDFASGALSAALLYYSYRSQKYQHCYIVTIVVIFLGLFPYLFFSMGGYHGGMIAFFIFAVSFTVFMLEGKSVFIMAALEIVIYAGICVYAYRNPDSVRMFPDERGFLISNLVDFAVTAAAIGTAMILHFRLYNEQQRELEKARQKLSEENATLEQLNRLKTEFLGNVSHELRTPLTVVSGYAQTARQQLIDQPVAGGMTAADKMKLISAEAERLALMVGQILDITRIEEGRMCIDKRPCHADEIIHSTIETHYPILNKNQNRLEIRIEENLPRILADPARISQVIVNLISNSVRFTSGGSITVEAKPEGEYVAISVSDTGVGIHTDRLSSIFERYNNQKSGGQNTGTGLGLYICRHIVEGHGGTISVESAEGKGTSVRFTIPVAKDQ